MSDLISRTDAIEAVICHIWHTPPEVRKLFNCENYVRDLVEEALKRLPSSEADEVVHCKDCKWRYVDDCPLYHEEWFTVDEGFGFSEDNYNIIDNTTDNGFCYMGEREEE